MRKVSLLFVLAVAAILNAATGLSMAQSPVGNTADTGAGTVLHGSVHPLVKHATDLGAADGNTILHGMTLNFCLTVAQKSQLDTLVHEQQNPASPQYHHWLTPTEFARSFGASQNSLSAASAWLQSQGLTIDHTAESRNAIHFSGSVRQVEQTFQTEIHTFRLNGESHFANVSELSVPSSLSGLISSVHGINDFRPHPKYIRPKPSNPSSASPRFTSGETGNHFLAPGDVATIYDITPLYSSGTNGTNQMIGIAGQTDIVLSDIESFRSAAGLPANDPTVYLIPGSADPGTSYNDLGEADLDLEWSGAVAQNASIVFINSTDAVTSLEYAIQNHINGALIPILSISYGSCEPDWSSSDIATLEADFEQANAQGQTIVTAAGDDGAADCDEALPNQLPIVAASQGLQVDYPSSSAYTTGVGGTEFNEGDSTGGTQYWKSNGSNDVISSAISYIPEMAWDDTPNVASAENNGGFSAGGGGKSTLFSKPAWQTGVEGIPADSARDVPDIAFSASADHDPYLICTQIQLQNGSWTGSCTNGFRYSDDSLEPVGGTSVAAPLFAGVLALIKEQHGGSLGNVDPLLYSIAASSSTYASAFHDITIGSNTVPCEYGSPDCQSDGVLGYDANTGYDQVTGLGSLDVSNFAQAVASTPSKSTPTAALSFSPNSPVVGQTVNITATLTGVSGEASPTGTVSFTVDGSSLQSGVSLINGVATTTYSFSTGGSHTVGLVYSGDDNYNGATSSATVGVATSVNAASTKTTVTTNSTTVALSSTFTLSATVTSQTSGTVSGTVTFTLGSSTLGSATVVSGASGTGTASLTVSAGASSGFVIGTNAITASYSGSSMYMQSSGNTSITVTNPGFTITAGNISIPSSDPGNYGSSTITLTSTGGYSGTIYLNSSSTDNLNATYTINPGSITLGAGQTGTSTISISTVYPNAQKGPAAHYHSITAASVAAGGGMTLAGLFLFGLRGRRRRWSSLLSWGLVLGIATTFIGCGSSSSISNPTSPGNYTVTITGVDSQNASITSSTTLTLTIQ